MTDYPTSNTSGRRRGSPRLIVLHSTESPPSSARAIAAMFQRPSVRASAHWIVGTDAVLSGVPESHVAWAAPGANHDGLQIEQCGYAGSTDWTSGAGARVVEATAKIVAGMHKRWGIPLRALTNAQIAAGWSGVVTHHQISQVYRRSDHWDPGPRYPLGRLLALASGQADPSSTKTEEPPAPKIPEEEPEMIMIRTVTPWGSHAYAELHLSGVGGARAIQQAEADMLYPVLGVKVVDWAQYQWLVTRAWEVNNATLEAMGREIAQSIDEAVAKVLAATEKQEA